MGSNHGVMEGKGAYNQHSRIPAGGSALALPHLQEAVRSIEIDCGDHPVVIADLGSSQGKNSLAPMSIAISALRQRAGVSRPIFVFHVDQPANDFNTLFEVLGRTDEEGRLLVLGGRGHSAAVDEAGAEVSEKQWITNYANNDFWHDDTSDGPIECKVKLDGRDVPVKGRAWVLVTPPDFAPISAMWLHCSMSWRTLLSPTAFLTLGCRRRSAPTKSNSGAIFIPFCSGRRPSAGSAIWPCADTPEEKPATLPTKKLFSC